MKNFDTRVYSIADFLEWQENKLLQLSPDFQRRAVWSDKAKSYLIDTIIRGKPVPKILITQQLQGTRSIRIVVDGQQRLRAILGYIDGAFTLSKAHNEELSGTEFDDLPEEIKSSFMQYELGVDVLFNMSYEDILDTFARLNSYTVKLNKQELFNAQYLGYFKQRAYQYGYKYVSYYLSAKVLTKAGVTRMAEAELTADLLVALVGGIQTNKNVEKYYKMYDESEGPLAEAGKVLDVAMSFIGTVYPGAEMANTNWSRVQLFYSLVVTFCHFHRPVQGLDRKLRHRLNAKAISKYRIILDQMSLDYDYAAAHPNSRLISSDMRLFLDRSRRATTDTSARVDRSTIICKRIIESF